MIPNQGLESWSAADSPLLIEYSLAAIEEIRRLVAEGLQDFARGGIEVAGLLYGTHDGSTVRILAAQSAPRESAEEARAALSRQLEQPPGDPRLEGLECLGWFVSHPRGQISLADSEQRIFADLFPQPWQVALVIRPGRASNMRAGFFVRTAAGEVQAERSYQEFDFPSRWAGVFASQPPQVPDRRDADPFADLPWQPPAEVEPEMAVPEFPSRWPWWLAAGLALAGLTAYVVVQNLPEPVPEPIALTVLDKDGQLQIEWDRDSDPVAGAARGSIEIVDGLDTQTVDLPMAHLRLGKFTYSRNTGDVEIRLKVETSDGVETQESAHFLGRALEPQDSGKMQDLEKRGADLQAEVTRLRQQNAAQAKRIQQLELTIRIMQSRSGPP